MAGEIWLTNHDMEPFSPHRDFIAVALQLPRRRRKLGDFLCFNVTVQCAQASFSEVGRKGKKVQETRETLEWQIPRSKGGGEEKSATSKYRDGGGGQKTFPASVLFLPLSFSPRAFFPRGPTSVYRIWYTLCGCAPFVAAEGRRPTSSVHFFPFPLAGVSRLRVPLFSRGDSSLYEQRERRRRRRRRRRGGGNK